MDTKSRIRENMTENTDEFLTLLEQHVRSRNYRKVDDTLKYSKHPKREILYDYVLNWIAEPDATEVREHIACCVTCAREVLHITRIEHELTQPQIPQPVWGDRVKQSISLPANLVRWVSELWKPQWAGVAVSAGDIPVQTKIFKMQEGEIEITCLWRAQYELTLAHIELSWTTNLLRPLELWVIFFHPKTKVVLVEILLGTSPEGGRIITSEELGFDPSIVPWALTILLKECRI
jgi:hypothetical protein